MRYIGFFVIVAGNAVLDVKILELSDSASAFGMAIAAGLYVMMTEKRNG